MKVKIFFCFLLTLFCVLHANVSFAQGETPEDIVVGGKAVCKLRGKDVPIRKLVADGNRLLFLEQDGVTKGSLQLQLFKTTRNALIDFNLLALLGEVANTDSFLSGKTFKFESDDSDFRLKVTILKNNNILDLSNQLSSGEKGSLSIKIKIKKSENNLASGNLRFVFKGTKLDITQGERDVQDSNPKAKVIVVCRFKDIPVEIKESEF